VASANRYLKQLQREAARNPAKAGVLGLLVVVALWFWGPLVWGWIGPSESASPPPTAPITRNEAGSGTTAPSATPSGPQAPTWQQLVEWRKHDPLTTAADTLKTRRDPFHAVKAAVAEAEVKSAEKVVQPVVLRPEDLGLKVSSTIVGATRRVALINGRTYREGQMIRCDKGGQPIDFRLVEVETRHVVLEREGERFALTIPEKKRSDRIELSGSPR